MSHPPGRSRQGQLPRRARVLLSGLMVVMIGVGGWALGLMATAVPPIPVGESSSFDGVEIWEATNRGGSSRAPVTVSWAMDSTGGATIGLSFDDEKATVGRPFYLVLTCGARLKDIHASGVVWREEVNSTGKCDSVNSSVTQVLRIFAYPPYVGLKGTPVVDWTATGAGQRASRAPGINLGQSGRRPEVDGMDTTTFREPSPDTSIAVELFGYRSEVVEDYSPTASDYRGLSVQSSPSAIELSDGYALGPGVRWTRDYSKRPRTSLDPSGLPSVVARWSDPLLYARSQRWLLLSGVLIGVAASLAVEGLFIWAHKGNDRDNIHSERRLDHDAVQST